MTAEGPSALEVWGTARDESHSSMRLFLPRDTDDSAVRRPCQGIKGRDDQGNRNRRSELIGSSPGQNPCHCCWEKPLIC